MGTRLRRKCRLHHFCPLLLSPLNHKVAVEHITHKWGREEREREREMGWDGDIGWGHGRKATTHSLTLYAVKLLGNDFVTLLVPQRALPPFSTRILTVAAATLFSNG